MAFIRVIFALTFVVLVSANPENLQQLYDAPSHHGGHPNDFSNDHVESVHTLFGDAAHERRGSVLTGVDGIRLNAAVERKATDALDSTLLINEAINRNEHIEAGTVTKEVTVDVFKTLTNVIYNSIPVTLTQFLKTTIVLPTVQILSTNVDDRVFVATAPVTRTNTITVTDTSTNFQCATEVSTDFYTVTHRAYDIRQQIVTSTILQTKVFRPTVISTLIKTEYDTETAKVTVTNTVYIEPRVLQTVGPNAGIGAQFGDRSLRQTDGPNAGIGAQFGDRSFGQTLPQDQQFSESVFAPDFSVGGNVHRGSHYY